MEYVVNKPNGTGFTRIINATRCSFDGIALAWKHESAFRQELALSVLMLPLALILSENSLQLLLLLLPLLLLLIVECLNSAIEATVDRISTSIHPLSKQAKDLGSAAVFFVIMMLMLTWGLVAYHNFLGS